MKKFYLKKITLFISKSVTRMKQFLGSKMQLYFIYTTVKLLKYKMK